MTRTFLTQAEKIYLRRMKKRGKRIPTSVLKEIFGKDYDPNYGKPAKNNT